MKTFTSILALSALLLSGCANLKSISRTTLIPDDKDGKILTVDAKQRHLIMSRVGSDGLTVCAEAAPDVFSALASSLALGGNAEGRSISGQLGLSSNETAATIERTQTLNMLRESFYRTCERYLSGAITKTQFIVQSARDQRTMVSILAIEQLTGVARQSSTIISPGGTSASAILGGDAAKLVRDYDQRLEKAKAARIEAEKAVEAAGSKECSSDPENKEANAEKCTALKLTAAEAKQKEQDAQKALDNIIEISKDLVSASVASTTAGTSQQGSAAMSDATRAIGVSAAVVEVVKLSSINEPLMFCLAFLQDTGSMSTDKNETVTKGCIEILISQAQADLKARGEAGLDPAALQAFADGVALSVKTNGILGILEKKINETDNAKLKASIVRLEGAVKFNGPSISSLCTTKADCIGAARAAYSIFISENLEKFEDALSNF